MKSRFKKDKYIKRKINNAFCKQEINNFEYHLHLPRISKNLCRQ